jgi:hypothetical protein
MPLNAPVQVEPEFIGTESRHAYETWKVTGSTGVAGDTVTFKTNLSKPDFILGSFVITTIAGQQVTISSLSALGNNTAAFRLFDRAGSGLM